MPDETPVEKTETPSETLEPQPTKPLTAEELQKALEQAQRSLKNKEEEAQRVHSKLKKFEEQEEEKRKAELSEIDKLKAELKETQKQLKKSHTDALKRTIAEKTGLPAVLADRLTGETPEALEADAKALLEALPKKKAPTLSTTNPGGASDGETDAEKRKRLNI
jgi:chromosome segregation ATPase